MKVWKVGQENLWSIQRVKFAAYILRRRNCVEVVGLQGQPVGQVRSERIEYTILKGCLTGHGELNYRSHDD